MNFNWKIGGEAGFGIMTSGLVFAKIATRSGYHVFDYPEYPSLIRGGHNTYEVRISDEPVHAPKWNIDLLICLNKETYDLHAHRLTKESVVVFDPEVFTPDRPCVKAPISFSKIKKEQKIDQMMVNTIAVGATVGFLKGDLEVFEKIIHEQFDRKGEEVVNFNLKLAKIGYEEAHKLSLKPVQTLKKKDVFRPQMVATGNEIFSLAAMAADCRYYASYPMTPASSILGVLAAWQTRNEMVVRHPEDELSVINSALGSAFAGVRSSVGTSGGGFALMTEALSYAGVAEIPIVVFLSMRSGPATGMPTWTEQGDLLFAVHAGHGEFPKIILAPGDQEEMAALTLEAFDLADIYQTPVLILSDKFLSESHKSVDKKEIDELFSTHTIRRGKITPDTKQATYLRYKDEEDGISEMLIPGKKGVYYQANSYEHVEDSHTTEDGEVRISQVNKRNKKIETYFKNDYKNPQVFGDLSQATNLVVSWGANKGPILDALTLLDEQTTAYIHFTHLYPIPEEQIVQLFAKFKGTRTILIENNSTGQFGQLLRMQTGIHLKEKLLKYDGRPFWPEEIRDYIQGEKRGTDTERKVEVTVTDRQEKDVLSKLQSLSK